MSHTEADPILLATSCTLPHLAAGKGSTSNEEHFHASQQTIHDNLELTAVAPYQAMPVSGHAGGVHRATAQPVIEPDVGKSEEEREAAINKVLSNYMAKLEERTRHHMGYPYNLDFDFEALDGLNKFCLNNLGDPFIESNYGVHSREFEVGVLNWFARLWQIEEEDYWGYITNCGTEGNLHGILVGRENLPDGILYASKESHYSVFKAARMYRMDSVKVETDETGEMDYEHLRSSLLANKDKPAILNVNIGTTVKGAVDNVDKVLEVLKECGFTEDRFFIHCDGALFGMMMPFLDREAPLVTFQKPIGSISVSGHKFIGAPLPCGVVMTRFRYVMALSSDIEYLNSRDATIMGSRNGHAPIYLWYSLTKKGYLGMQKDVEKCINNARILVSMLEKEGVKTMLNPLSNTVVFERPVSIAFIRKWQLACEGDIAHVVVMPNISVAQLQDFVVEYVQQRVEAAAGAATNGAVAVSNGGASGGVVVSNGVTNGVVAVSNGMTNGVASGDALHAANGAANGITNGVANGVSCVNGTVNGVSTSCDGLKKKLGHGDVGGDDRVAVDSKEGGKDAVNGKLGSDILASFKDQVKV